MTMDFPNKSRSFETNRHRVRFWGYDSSIEITFFVGADALAKISPDVTSTEAALLTVFDGAIDRIHEVARKVYKQSRDRTYSYDLAASDF